MKDNIIDYKVIHELSPETLKEKVKELIALMGWQPIGGLAISFAPNNKPIFAQALVMYAK